MKNLNSIYYYTNKLGRTKKLLVYNTDVNAEGKVYNAIYDEVTGEYCGGGYNSHEELAEFLAGYGIEYKRLVSVPAFPYQR